MTEQFTDETKLELLTAGSDPDETFNNNMEELNDGLSYEALLDEAGSAGQWFRFQNDGTAVKAQADSQANSLVAGVLTLDGVQFDKRNYRYIGTIEVSGWGLDANTLYYLDPNNAGEMVNAQPGAGVVVELGRSDSTGEKFYIQIKVYLTEVTGGDHSTLANLDWSVADHVIDTNVDFASNGQDNVAYVQLDEDGWIGNSVATERLVFDGTGGEIDLLGANFDFNDNSGINCGGLEMHAAAVISGESTITLQTAAAGQMNFDAGGVFAWRDVDDGNRNVMTLNSATGEAEIIRSSALTNTIGYPLKLNHITSGAAAAGFGTGISFWGEDNGGVNEEIGQMTVHQATHNTAVMKFYTQYGNGVFQNAISFWHERVGIGTDAPATALEVVGNITVGEDNWIGIGAALERIVFDGTGNQIAVMSAQFGIGILTPSSLLHVFDSGGTALGGTGKYSAWVQGSASNKGVVLGWDTSGVIGIVGASGASGELAFWTHNGATWGERMRLDHDGNVGIATTSAGAPLDVNGAAVSKVIRAYGTTNPYISILDQTNSTESILQSLNTYGRVGTTSNHGFRIFSNNVDAITIDTSQNATFSANIIMPEDGFIGIAAGSERIVFDGTGGFIDITAAILRVDHIAELTGAHNLVIDNAVHVAGDIGINTAPLAATRIYARGGGTALRIENAALDGFRLTQSGLLSWGWNQLAGGHTFTFNTDTLVSAGAFTSGGLITAEASIVIQEDGYIGISGAAERIIFDGTGGIIQIAGANLVIADGGSISLQESLIWTGATTENILVFPIGQADAWLWKDSAGNAYAKVDTAGDAIYFGPAGGIGSAELKISTLGCELSDDMYFRQAGADYRRYYHMTVSALDPGLSGATWTDATANNLDGFQINNSTELLRLQTDVHADWNGTTDHTVAVGFQLLDAGNPGDTVDLKLVCYYMGVGDVVTKTQTVEVATVTDGTQFKLYVVEFTIDEDLGGNNIDPGDKMSMILNIETDTSEIDNILIVDASHNYNTTHVGTEAGDI